MNRRPDDNPVASVPTADVPRGGASVLPFRPAPLPAGSDVEHTLMTLYSQEYENLLRFAAFHVGEDEAHDVVQASFVELWHRRPTDAGGTPIQSYKAMLFRAVRFRTLDYRKLERRRAARLGVYLADWSDRVRRWMQPEERLNQSALAQAIEAAVASMPPRAKEIYALHHVAGYSASEICERTGLGREGVRSLIARGNRILRDRLERDGFSPAARRSLKGARS